MRLNERILSIPNDQFNYLLKYSTKSQSIKGKECEELIMLPYWMVKVELPDLINSGDFEQLIFKVLQENSIFVKSKTIAKLSINEALPFCFWVRSSLERIVQLERDYLTNQPDNDLINAGIESLNELGDLNVIDMLAGGDVLKWDSIKKMPYHQVFDKLRKNKLETDIQRSLQKIQRQKSKR